MKESSFQFSKPLIEDIQFKVHEGDIKGNRIEIKNELFLKIDESDDPNISDVHLKVRLGGSNAESNGIDINALPFYIEVSMKSTFTFDNISDMDLKKDLLTKNAPILILSYIRPIVHMITSMSKYPAYDIPFLDFTEESK